MEHVKCSAVIDEHYARAAHHNTYPMISFQNSQNKTALLLFSAIFAIMMTIIIIINNNTIIFDIMDTIIYIID